MWTMSPCEKVVITLLWLAEGRETVMERCIIWLHQFFYLSIHLPHFLTGLYKHWQCYRRPWHFFPQCPPPAFSQTSPLFLSKAGYSLTALLLYPRGVIFVGLTTWATSQGIHTKWCPPISAHSFLDTSRGITANFISHLISNSKFRRAEKVWQSNHLCLPIYPFSLVPTAEGTVDKMGNGELHPKRLNSHFD